MKHARTRYRESARPKAFDGILRLIDTLGHTVFSEHFIGGQKAYRQEQLAFVHQTLKRRRFPGIRPPKRLDNALPPEIVPISVPLKSRQFLSLDRLLRITEHGRLPTKHALSATVERLLKADELARRLNCGKSTIYRLAQTGKIPAIGIGDTGVRFDLASRA